MRRVFLFCAAVACILMSFAVTHAQESAFVSIQPEVATCMPLVDTKKRTDCYASLCSAVDKSCATMIVKSVTALSGPEGGTQAIDDFMSVYDQTITGDGHDLAHQVGRQTVRSFGGDYDLFLRCPQTHFMGCTHGFFEQMLTESLTMLEAATSICSKAPDSEVTFCYHGIGHGIMMARGNDVGASLELCDDIRSEAGRQGCYQGVFMEGVNSYFAGTARSGTFSAEDPLAPCRSFDRKYLRQCYGQHADYLLRTLSGSLLAPVDACVSIGDAEFINECVQHLGQNMATEEYQRHFLSDAAPEHLVENAQTLCSRFPADYHTACLRGAIHNFFLYDMPERGVELCNRSATDGCSEIVISYMQRAVTDHVVQQKICGELQDGLDRFRCVSWFGPWMSTDNFVSFCVAFVIVMSGLFFLRRKH